MTTPKSKAWRVVAAGTDNNLALGVLEAWSVIKGGRDGLRDTVFAGV